MNGRAMPHLQPVTGTRSPFHPDAEIEIRSLIENWAIWRDTSDWDRFEQLWHPDGRMVATFFDGTASDFIKAARAAKGKVLVHHVLGGASVRVNGARASAKTRMTIHMRVPVEGVLCDVACIGLFLDRFVLHEGRWALLLRQPVYEKDRLDPVLPGAFPTLDEAFLAGFPEGYRFTAYAPVTLGLAGKPEPSGDRGRTDCTALCRSGRLARRRIRISHQNIYCAQKTIKAIREKGGSPVLREPDL